MPISPDSTWQVWLRYAEEELAIARVLKDDHPGGAVVHAQQAAEKAVKALWVWSRGQDPPRVHHVERLLAELGASRPLLTSGGDLTDGYFAARYPPFIGEPAAAEITVDDAAERLRDAEEIVRWVRQKLPGA